MNNDDSQSDQTQSNSTSSDIKTDQEKMLNPSRLNPGYPSLDHFIAPVDCDSNYHCHRTFVV